VGKVDVSENLELASQFNIFSVPRVLIFNKNAKPVHELKGLVPESEIFKLVNGILGAA
jgi:thioredoxin-like negative regulator of GroEL